MLPSGTGILTIKGRAMASALKRRFTRLGTSLFCALAFAQGAAFAQDASVSPKVLELVAPPADAQPRRLQEVTSTPSTVLLDRQFLDTFQSFAPNGVTWRHYYNHNTYDSFRARTLQGNQEQQVYVDPGFKGTAKEPLGLNPFALSSGILRITGQKASPADARHLDGFEYTSGMLSTQDSFEQRYGYFEARMRAPSGQGLWSAFWLKTHGEHTPRGVPAWPPEIDVMEFIGSEPERYSLAVHWDVMPDNKKDSSKVSPVRPSDRFHTYGVLWMPDQTVFYLDRRPVRVIETKRNHNVPMFMVLNLALGGKWPGKVDDAVLPAQLEIDWVAAYQVAPGQ